MIASLAVQAGTLKNEPRLADRSTVQQSTIPLVKELMEWGCAFGSLPSPVNPTRTGGIRLLALGACLPDPFGQHGVLDIARGASS